MWKSHQSCPQSAGNQIVVLTRYVLENQERALTVPNVVYMKIMGPRNHIMKGRRRTMSNKKVIPMRAKDKFPKRILFTHTDLDGVGCAVIYNKCFPNVQVYFTEPTEVDHDIAEVLSEEDENVPVMISDLSVNEEIAQYLEQRGNAELIDHHFTAERLNKYSWAMVEASLCATKLMFNVMEVRFMLSDYKLFSDLVDNYDRWGEGKGPTDQAKDMSRLCFLLGPELFLGRMVTNSSTKFSEAENFLISIDKLVEARYIEESIQKVIGLVDPQGNSYGLLAAERYTSALGNAILQRIPNIEYIILLDYRRDRVHLRSKGKVDVGELAKRCGGGGHHRAAGFPMRQGAFKTFTACDGDCELVQNLKAQLRGENYVDGSPRAN
jgi:oligoribonuclease NrnB/cAMP/cGMP phosphodiesterase (DHH superfamily)